MGFAFRSSTLQAQGLGAGIEAQKLVKYLTHFPLRAPHHLAAGGASETVVAQNQCKQSNSHQQSQNQRK